MDQQGFRNLLVNRNVHEDRLAPALALAERFDTFISGKPASAETAWAFSKILVEEGNNTEDNYITLIRYCRFIQNHDMYVALMELVDGGEVGGNLYRKVGKRFGKQLRREIFAGIGVAPYGTPTPEKPAYLQPVIERLESKIGKDACADFLSAGLRTLPTSYFLGERRKYKQAADIDEYLRQRKEGFVAQLEACLREGRPFFAQEITEEVIAFVRSDPEIGGGRREGNIIYETKIPYMTQKYLAETDPSLRRYYYCHCPWAREAIKHGDVRLAETFCNCSGGFHKKTFEVIFKQALKVEVLESALKGDDRCRFAIHLPSDAGLP
jgi:hypothetical protein